MAKEIENKIEELEEELVEEERPKLPTEGEEKKRKKEGRPTMFTEELVNKLEDAFQLGCDVSEACYYANISRTAYYKFLRRYPYFVDRFETLRERPALRARISVTEGIEKDPRLALDYLRNKKNDEFGTKDKVEASVTLDAKNKLRTMESIINDIRARTRGKRGN